MPLVKALATGIITSSNSNINASADPRTQLLTQDIEQTREGVLSLRRERD